MHLVTLSFDDGFRKSCLRTAEVYEAHGLSACFNVIATGHWDSFVPPDPGHAGYARGDFDLWNALQDRGHEVMPHGYRHANKARLPEAEAKQLILDCLDIFSRELAGFRRERAIFNFPYNAATPALAAWLPGVVRAFRAGGPGINPLPKPGMAHLTTTSFGPGNCEHDIDEELGRLLAQPSGWLLYTAHGVDGEGWGPLNSDYLDRLLTRLQAIETVRILPTGQALDLALPLPPSSSPLRKIVSHPRYP